MVNSYQHQVDGWRDAGIDDNILSWSKAMDFQSLM
jgi:hypothetical protein